MDAAQTPQTAPGCPDHGQRGNDDPVMITDDNGFDFTRPVHQQPDLALDFRGYGTQGPGQIAAYYFIGGDVLPGQPIQKAELLGFQSGNVTGYSSDMSPPKTNTLTWCGTRCPGKRDYVTNVMHTGDELHQSLETETESGMGH